MLPMCARRITRVSRRARAPKVQHGVGFFNRVTETLKAAERKLREHRRALVRVARDVEEPLGLVARSSTMRQVVDLARRVATLDRKLERYGSIGGRRGLRKSAPPRS